MCSLSRLATLTSGRFVHDLNSASGSDRDFPSRPSNGFDRIYGLFLLLFDLHVNWILGKSLVLTENDRIVHSMSGTGWTGVVTYRKGIWSL